MPRPSDSDCRATRRLAAAAEALDCTILDHLVFAGARMHQLPAHGPALEDHRLVFDQLLEPPPAREFRGLRWLW